MLTIKGGLKAPNICCRFCVYLFLLNRLFTVISGSDFHRQRLMLIVCWQHSGPDLKVTVFNVVRWVDLARFGGE